MKLNFKNTRFSRVLIFSLVLLVFLGPVAAAKTFEARGRQEFKEKYGSSQIVDSPRLNAIYSAINNFNPGLPQVKEIKVVEYQGFNAFQYPGGYVYFTHIIAGFLANRPEECADAFVLAHELSHFYLKHNEKNMALSVLPSLQQEYRQKIEFEADEKAFELIAKTPGPNPAGGIAALMRFKPPTGEEPEEASTHPTRKNRLTRQIALLKDYSGGVVEIVGEKDIYVNGKYISTPMETADSPDFGNLAVAAGNLSRLSHYNQLNEKAEVYVIPAKENQNYHLVIVNGWPVHKAKDKKDAESFIERLGNAL